VEVTALTAPNLTLNQLIADGSIWRQRPVRRRLDRRVPLPGLTQWVGAFQRLGLEAYAHRQASRAFVFLACLPSASACARSRCSWPARCAAWPPSSASRHHSGRCVFRDGFWFRHVRRGWNRLETGQVNAVLRDIESDLDHLAAATYEDLCRQLVATGGLGPNRFGRVGRWWNRSDEMGRGVPTSRRHISLRERFSPETMWGQAVAVAWSWRPRARTTLIKVSSSGFPSPDRAR